MTFDSSICLFLELSKGSNHLHSLELRVVLVVHIRNATDENIIFVSILEDKHLFNMFSIAHERNWSLEFLQDDIDVILYSFQDFKTNEVLVPLAPLLRNEHLGKLPLAHKLREIKLGRDQGTIRMQLSSSLTDMQLQIILVNFLLPRVLSV